MTFLLEALSIVAPAIEAFIKAREEGANADVAAMKAIAAMEDERAKKKFPGYGG